MFSTGHGDRLIIGYVNSDYVGDMYDKRYTTWYIFTLA